MLKKRTPLLVGLLVVVGAFAFILTFGSLDKGVDTDDAYEVNTLFSDATGLVENSRVMLSGIPVGAIKSIRLDTEDPTKARVVLVIEKRITLYEGVLDAATGRWVNGATAKRLQASLLGDYYISITPGIAGPKIPPGGEIHNIDSESGLSAVLNQLEESTAVIFPKLEKISDDIAAITGSVRKNFADEEGTAALQEIRDNIRETTVQVAGLSKEIRGFVDQAIVSHTQDVKNIIENVEATTRDLRSIAARADARLDHILVNVDEITGDLRGFVGRNLTEGAVSQEGTVAHALAKIDKSAVALEGTMESARTIAERIEAGQGTVGRLLTDEKLIDDVEDVVSDVKGITGPIGRLQVKVEFRSEYNIGQASLKSYVSLSLYPKPDKFYFIQLVSDPAGLTETKQRVTTTNDPSLPPVLVEEIVSTSNKLKFTAQFGKRWHFLTFRYGIMESTGGLGIDLDLLGDRLRMRTDVFDFGRDDWPRLRMLAAWEFAKHFYVAAGIDNVLNGARRDYFVGLGMGFTDEDLKSILPFVPTSGL
ncbi:MAG: MCE family protein [Deltaproteobacteria bacterium]|nr:MCE family protein [Deltaproteobacteria bacterium]MCB9786067.1 MCE family protein [Deltaproteobacteria bacterium]